MVVTAKHLFFSWKNIVLTIVCGLLGFVFTDYIAYSEYGLFVLAGYVVLVLILFFGNAEACLFLVLAGIFIFPTYPRDLFAVSGISKSERALTFTSFTDSQLFGFSMFVWMILLLAFISVIFLIHKGCLSKVFYSRHLLLPYLLIILLTISACVDILLLRENILIKEFIYDYRFSILQILGALIISALYLKLKDNLYTIFIRHLWIIGLSIGFKTILFVINDTIFDTLKPFYSTQPFFVIPLIFAFAITISQELTLLRRVIIYLLLLLGSFDIGRTVILFFAIDIFLFAVLAILSNRTNIVKSFLQFTGLLSGFLSVVVYIIFLKNETLYNILIYKLSFFYDEIGQGELSESPAVRVGELKNIITEGINYLYPLFAGKGAGGYFTYFNHPLAFKFSPSDYSEYELENQIFFHPHEFVNYWLLKGGVIGLVLWVLYIGMLLFFAKRLLRSQHIVDHFAGFFCIFFFIFAIDIYWLQDLSFFTGILFPVLIIRVFKLTDSNIRRHKSCQLV